MGHVCFLSIQRESFVLPPPGQYLFPFFLLPFPFSLVLYRLSLSYSWSFVFPGQVNDLCAKNMVVECLVEIPIPLHSLTGARSYAWSLNSVLSGHSEEYDTQEKRKDVGINHEWMRNKSNRLNTMQCHMYYNTWKLDYVYNFFTEKYQYTQHKILK